MKDPIESKEMSLREYARHRGVSLAGVQKAIKSGRISVSRIQQRGSREFPIVDADECDTMWQQNTDPVQQRVATRAEKYGAKYASTHEEATPSFSEDPAPVHNPLPQSPAKAQTGQYGEMYTKGRAIREQYAARMAALDYAAKTGKLVDIEKLKVKLFNVSNEVQRSLLGIRSRVCSRIVAEYQTAIMNIKNQVDTGAVITSGDLDKILNCVTDIKTVSDILDTEIRNALTGIVDGNVILRE